MPPPWRKHASQTTFVGSSGLFVPRLTKNAALFDELHWMSIRLNVTLVPPIAWMPS
jgi:hypothetical protein